MTFETIVPKIATSIGVISIDLYDGDGTNPNRSVRYDVEVVDQDGETMQGKLGDLVPHISPEDRAWLIDFQNRMRAKANAEILPILLSILQESP